LNAASGVIAGTPTTAGNFALSVKLVDSSAPTVQTATESISFAVAPLTSQPVGETFAFKGLPSTQQPAKDIVGATLQLSQSATAAFPATLTIGFTPSTNQAPPGYMDPALQFLDGGGNQLGITYNIVVPAGSTSFPLPQIDPGTVAGDIAIALSVSGQTVVSSTVNVPLLAPTIEPGSVQIVNITGSSFEVELLANSTPRDLATATFIFSPAGGTQISGQTTFVVNVSPQMTEWYGSADGLKYGSAFSLTIGFTFTGSSDAIQSVAVSLTNSAGTSGIVTGTK
jgi:hypothetical protein